MVGCLYDEQKKNCLVGITAGNHEAPDQMSKRMGDQTGLEGAQELVALIDRAPWIRNQIEFHGISKNMGLDFWHLRDHTQETRRAVFGAESEDALKWRDDLMHKFRDDGYDAAWDSLTTWRKPLRGTKRVAAQGLMQYAAELHHMIRYPKFRRRHWQIGSGPTATECKKTTQRVKGRGRRWDATNAEAMMTLAAVHDSGQWNKHWTTLKPKRLDPARESGQTLSSPVFAFNVPAKNRFSFCPGVRTSFCCPLVIQFRPIFGLRWMSTSSS